MDVTHIATCVLEDDSPGPLGVGLWRSSLKQLPTPPWAPRRDFASLSGGKSASGWRNLWVLGGDVGRPLNDIWRSVDGGRSWGMIEAGPHWCPRSRLAVCGAATNPSGASASGRPIGIMYVVGGQTHAGLYGDVWASDTAGRTWHCMIENGPFGPRCDMACAVVPPDPMCLVVAGGISVDYHRDVWLSRDAGETFCKVDMPLLPACCTLVQFPPHLLCAARSYPLGPLALWQLKFKHEPEDGTDSESLTTSACLDAMNPEFGEFDPHLGNHVLRPPRVSMDLELNIAFSWDPTKCCLRAYQLLGGSIQGVLIAEVSASTRHAHVLCDMDAANVGWDLMRHGRIWLLAEDGSQAWATSRSRFFEQDEFMKLVGAHLALVHGIPWELWLGRVRPMLLPFQVMRGDKVQRKSQHLPKVVDFGVWKVIHKPRVAVRKEPSTEAEILGAESFGSIVSPLSLKDGWLRVAFGKDRKIGWMLVDGTNIGLGTLLERVA